MTTVIGVSNPYGLIQQAGKKRRYKTTRKRRVSKKNRKTRRSRK